MRDSRPASRMTVSRLTAVTLLALSLLVPVPTLAAEPDLSDSPLRLFLPTVRESPGYPREAFDAGVEGWVVVIFDIDAAGNVVNPRVADSCAMAPDSDFCADEYQSLFDATALNTISRFRYPAREAGSEPMPGGSHTFTFCLNEGIRCKPPAPNLPARNEPAQTPP